MSTVNIPRGSVEYVTANVTANVSLDAQTVEVALSTGSTHVWLPGTWTGSAATTRQVRTTSAVTFSTAAYPGRSYTVYVRVTDTPEIPIIKAGVLRVDG